MNEVPYTWSKWDVQKLATAYLRQQGFFKLLRREILPTEQPLLLGEVLRKASTLIQDMPYHARSRHRSAMRADLKELVPLQSQEMELGLEKPPDNI